MVACMSNIGILAKPRDYTECPPLKDTMCLHRLHDHEALHTLQSQNTPIAPVYIFDRNYLASQSPQSIQLSLSAVRNLRKAFQKLGGDLIVREGRAEDVLPALIKECEADSIWCYDDVSSSQRALVASGMKALAASSINTRKWTSRLRPSVRSSRVGNSYPDYLDAIRGSTLAAPLPSLSSPVTLRLPKETGRLPTFEELLEAAHGHEEEEVKATRAAAARDEFLTPVYGPVEGGEELALDWLNEYLEVGSEAFGQKHLPLSGDNGLERYMHILYMHVCSVLSQTLTVS
jgi:deoxyribodipyrimidine photolyase